MRAAAAALVLCGVSAPAQPRPEPPPPAVAASFAKLNPAIRHYRVFHRQALNETYTLLAVGGSVERPADLPTGAFFLTPNDAVGIFLAESAEPRRVWELAMIPSRGLESVIRVERADSGSVVLAQQTEYGVSMESTKLFFDTRSRRLLGITSFQPVAAPIIVFIGSTPRACFVGAHQQDPLVACWD